MHTDENTQACTYRCVRYTNRYFIVNLKLSHFILSRSLFPYPFLFTFHLMYLMTTIQSDIRLYPLFAPTGMET